MLIGTLSHCFGWMHRVLRQRLFTVDLYVERGEMRQTATRLATLVAQIGVVFLHQNELSGEV
jgi:hypothetical protein